VNPTLIAPVTPRATPTNPRGSFFACSFPLKREKPRLSPGLFGSFQNLDREGGSFFQDLDVREIVFCDLRKYFY
jgi:hypothetical protein